MAAFRDNFDLQQFKQAFNTMDDMDAYNLTSATTSPLTAIPRAPATRR